MPLVTVSDLWRFALPATTRLLVGAGGLSKQVTWARLLRARPAAIASVEAGEVWLLSPGAVQQVGEGRLAVRLVQEVADAGVVAFVLAERPAEEVLKAADSAAMPVLLLPPETPLAEAEKAIVSLVVDRDRAIAGRVQQIYDGLLATLVEDDGAERLVQMVHQVTGKAVYLLDEHLQPNAQAGGDDASATAVADVRRRWWDGQLSDLAERLVAARSPSGSLDRAALVRPLKLRGAVAGHLALLGPRDEFADLDYQVADRAASVLAIELAKQSAVVEARLRIQGDFLEDLLDGTASGSASASAPLAARARALGYDLTRPHVVFVLRPRHSPDRAQPRLHQRFVDLARRRLVTAEAGALLREDHARGSVQVLAPAPASAPVGSAGDAAWASAWVEEIRSGLEQALAPDGCPLIAGVGRSPEGPSAFHAAVREAAQAAEIAASLGSGASTLHFAQLGVLRLIFPLAGHPELQAFRRDTLGALEDYDDQHRSELVHTLAAFLAAGGNHMRAARAIHVHRNTLIYRLERIRHVLGRDSLDEADTRLNLQLALKIRGALGAPAREAGA